jgi:hypothetical protein
MRSVYVGLQASVPIFTVVIRKCYGMAGMATTDKNGLDFKIAAEPVVTAEYVAKLQSVDVQVTSSDRVVKLVDSAADVLAELRGTLAGKLAEFSYDLRPLIVPAYERLARPLDIPMGDAHGCARFRLLGVEAGPTVLAGGIEKDLAIPRRILEQNYQKGTRVYELAHEGRCRARNRKAFRQAACMRSILEFILNPLFRERSRPG